MDKVCVVGLGYIGLPTALIMAANGVQVVGVDYNKGLVDTLQSGRTTFDEKGLDELFAAAKKGGIEFSTDYISTDIYIVAVPTPYDDSSKRIDPEYLCAAIQSVLEICPKGSVVVIESTVSPGTIDHHVRPLFVAAGLVPGKDIHIAHAPERIIPGNMLYELVNNSRTIGTDDISIGDKVKWLYSSFCKGDIVLTDIRTAEMTKVVENTFRDINIAFANELAKICRQDDMDVYEIIRIANMHPRVNILQPGPGVGGHCISVDPWFLVGDYPGLSLLIHEARKINDSMPAFVLSRVSDIMREKGLDDISRVGFYGVTYKEDVDDTRESPTLQLYDKMRRHLGGAVKFYDPMLGKSAIPGQIMEFEVFLDAIDVVVIMVSHSHIKNNMDKLQGKIVLDTRNVCNLNGCYKL
jgi:UDP-N-acetyl-D-mannosaminuronic acid dehydrogenase